MTPQGMHKFLKSSLYLDSEESRESHRSILRVSELEGKKKGGKNHVEMDMGEFLVHLNLHLNMNLDYVFSSDLKEILKFFTAIEDFMEKTFGNKELEIKIDMMRLIIRMTNATSFIDKIYMLSQMTIKYLDYWQTFSLFTQVLMSELLTVGQEPTKEYQMTKKTQPNKSTLEKIDEDHSPKSEIRISSFSNSKNINNIPKPKRKKGLFGMNLEDSVTKDLDSDDDQALDRRL